MAVNRNYLQCSVCGARTITQTALNYADYLEFAFPCHGCAVEIRFGLELHPPNVKYVKIINAEWVGRDDTTAHKEVFDADHLIPVLRDQKFFSPFLATAGLLGVSTTILYHQDSSVRQFAIDQFWSRLEQLGLHFSRKQWDLFDKQYKELGFEKTLKTPLQRRRGLDNANEIYGGFFRPKDRKPYTLIRKRIKLAKAASKPEVIKLVSYFRGKGKDADLDHQIQDIRRRWAKLYSVVAPIYTIYYWDDKVHNLSNYTLAQKRFDELKSFYIDCFETFCRISVIAAGIEGIITEGKAVIPRAKGEFSLEEFDLFKNGSKPDILKRLHNDVANLFVPFIDHRLRNGIGHHAAKYVVVGDRIDYVIENDKGLQRFTIPYILFCEKVVKLYAQIELVSLYVNWLMSFTR
jgi:hypothetical protein